MSDPVEVQPGDKVFTNAAGETVAVAPGFERDAMAQGFAPTETTYVKDGNDVRALSGQEAAAALTANPFASTVRGGDFFAAEERKDFESLPGRAGAFGIGAGRGLSFGASDWVGSELGGDDYRTYANKQGFYNPGTLLTGEVAGMLAPALVSGGASSGASLGLRGARLATAPARGVFALAEGAGGLATRGLVGAGLAEGGLAARAGGALARGAVEGAVFGGGAEVSKQSLAGTPLDIDKIVASAAHTAVIGGVLSGGLAVAGAGLSRLRAGRAADGLEGKMADGAIAQQAEEAGAAAEAKAIGMGAAPEAAAAARAEAHAAATETGLAARAAEQPTFGQRAVSWFEDISGEARSGKSAGQKAEALADEMAVRAVGLPRAEMRALYRQSEEAFTRVAKTVRNDIPAALGKPLSSLSKEEIAIGAEKVQGGFGSKIEDVVTRAETANGGRIEMNVKNIAEEMREKILKPLADDPSAVAQHNWAKGWIDRYEQSATAQSWRGSRDLRSSLDKRIKWGKQNLDETTATMQEMRGLLENRLVQAGEDASAKAGGSFAKEYAEAKAGYAAASTVLKGAEEADVRLLTNRGLGFSEQVGGGFGASTGATVGGAILGPAGALVGGALGYLGAAYMQRQIKLYGPQIASEMLGKLATEQVLNREIAAVSAKVSGAVKSAVSGKASGDAAKVSRFQGEIVAVEGKAANDTARAAEAKAAAKAPEKAEATSAETEAKGSKLRGVLAGAAGEAGKRAAPGAGSVAGEAKRKDERDQANLEERYRRERERVAQLVVSPARIEAQTAALAAGRADIAAGVRAQLAKHAKWLQDQAPKSAAAATSLTPHLVPDSPAPTEMAAWLRKAEGLKNPMDTLDDIGNGTASREALEALAFGYPDLHREIVTQVYQELGQAKEPVPYAKRLQLGLLLGVPTDPTMTPKFIAAAQESYKADPALSQASPPPRQGKAPDLSSAWETRTEKLLDQ